MCGITGYVGKDEAAPILIKGLARLEYRGYDSAGIAVLEGHRIRALKMPGKIKELYKGLKKTRLNGTTGIAHLCLNHVSKLFPPLRQARWHDRNRTHLV